MDILLVVRDKLVRDQVKVGLQQFPEFSVTTGEGYAAINELRQRHCDCVFVASDPTDGEGLRLLNHLRSFDRTTEVVPIATERHARDMAGEKTRLNITAFLHTPIQPAEFFRLVGRLRARKLEADARR
jgi:DNA-binding NarL/FixJ family response regulator